MPRKEDVFPSLRPRSVPPLTCTTGGLRFGPADMAAAAVGVECSCADASLPTPAIAPPINAVVVPNICRRLIRFVRASRTWSAMLPPVSRRLSITQEFIGRCSTLTGRRRMLVHSAERRERNHRGGRWAHRREHRPLWPATEAELDAAEARRRIRTRA